MDSESRRCTASQFFMEEEQSATESLSTYDRVVELLNQASLLQKDSQRVNNLKLVQELIVHKEPNLLDNFLDEVLAFQNDRSTDVKKTLINFLEDACKKDPDVLAKVIGNLCFMLNSDVVPIVKKVILSMATLYKVSLLWVCKAKKITETIEQTWQYVNQMKQDIIEMIDSDNEGFRTHSIKFVEAVIMALSRKTAESIVPTSTQVQVSLDQIPDNHDLLKVKKLEEEGESALETLLVFMGSVHISSVNLMTCMGSVTTIARQRPQYMARVVQSFETLHVNLPPTLSKSQVASVRKNMKLHMLSLLRHPAAVDFHAQITTLLTDLGASQSEVMKAMPKEDVSRKRKAEEKLLAAKKAKVQQSDVTPAREEEDDYGMTPFVGLGVSAPKPTESLKQTAIDISAEDLITRLTPQNVADLVLLSMVMLPDTMPAQFQATYTPIAAAGTQAQIKHLSRLLATQLTAANLGKGYNEIQQQLKKQTAQQVEEEDVEAGTSPKHVIQTVVGGAVPGGSAASDDIKKPPLPMLSQPPSVPRKSRAFKLSGVTQTLERVTMDSMALRALERILLCEKTVKCGESANAQMKIATSLVAQFGGQLKDELQNFIFADLRNRAEIALAWIYQEYANFQGYNRVTAGAEKPNVASYDECLTRLLNGLLERPDQREGLFSRLILEAPYITPNAIQVLKKYCQDETRIYLGMTTLKELIVKRPCMKLEFLDVLLDFTSHEKNDVRNTAIRVTKKLHERKDLEEPIERYALYYLKYLLQPQPPPELPTPIHVTGDDVSGTWTEDSIKLCLYLYLGLLPINHKLIHELANVYTGTKPDIKRTILRVLETPVKGMGMDSPELLLLVDNCPKGAETLITRIIHILTDKAAPSQALVDRVRDLYHKRVSDVRFLIPVLTGLSKKEVVAALPKLIKLNPVVVKEVFNRLLSAHGQDSGYSSPLTPAELLIALHYVDPQKCDMKTIIKATNLCFAERVVYTQEVLAIVMQHLMDQSPLPTLLMRTVLQSLAMYPRLIGFVMNIMQRLITKQVWKQKKVWEGFVRCCQRTKPQSFQVLLQLPALQLKNAFEICPDLREPLLHHVKSFTPHQRAHIPKAIMTILERDPLEEQRQRAKRVEDERLAVQEKLYQQKLEEERRVQQEKARKRQQEEDAEAAAMEKQLREERQKEVRDESLRHREMKREDDETLRQREMKREEDETLRQTEMKRADGEALQQREMKREEDETVQQRKMKQEEENALREMKRERDEALQQGEVKCADGQKKLEEEQPMDTAEEEEEMKQRGDMDEADVKQSSLLEGRKQGQDIASREQQMKAELSVKEREEVLVAGRQEQVETGVCEGGQPESVAMEASDDVTDIIYRGRMLEGDEQGDESPTEALTDSEETELEQTGDNSGPAESESSPQTKSEKTRGGKELGKKNKATAVLKRRSPRTRKS